MSEHNATREIDSPVGRIVLAASDEGLTHVLFADRPGRPQKGRPGSDGDATEEAARILDSAETQLREYFAGDRKEFDIPLAPTGTEFQMAVWRGLCDIPFGEAESYGSLARRIGRPKAVRAVGTANGANPISIIVPCHRVIGSDRSLTGYGGGLEVKKALLELEGASGTFSQRGLWGQE